MAQSRKRYQGVINIIRFNWHFYLIALLFFFTAVIISTYLQDSIRITVIGIVILMVCLIGISLIVSYYIYDLSDLYQLNFLSDLKNKKILNLHAGFDETSSIIKNKFPESTLINCDFYNPQKHTEVSIKRARKAYPPTKDCIEVSTEELPFYDNSFGSILAILSAHEIRNKNERINLFKELHRILKPGGKVFVTEHLRDINNFLAFSVGFFHFHSKSSWLEVFSQANLIIIQEVKTTPFVTTFILEKHGDTF